MGLSVSSLFSSLASLVRWSKDQDVRILMLGLDSAGKVCDVDYDMPQSLSHLPELDDHPLPIICVFQ